MREARPGRPVQMGRGGPPPAAPVRCRTMRARGEASRGRQVLAQPRGARQEFGERLCWVLRWRTGMALLDWWRPLLGQLQGQKSVCARCG